MYAPRKTLQSLGPSTSPLPPGFFGRIPAEIIALITEQADDTTHSETRASLCSVNKLFNATCTAALYGSQIYIRDDTALRQLFRTLFDLRPDLVLKVNNLQIKGQATGQYTFGGLSIKNREVLRHLRSILRACTNLHTLSIVASDDSPASILLNSLFAESDEADTRTSESGAIAAKHPIFPFLRDLELHFRLDRPIFDFLMLHHAALHVLRVHDSQRFPWDARALGLQISNEYSLAPSAASSHIECSAFLVPAFAPDSHIEHATMEWQARDGDVDVVAEDIVQSLARSRRPIKTVVYTSQSWNIKFMRAAATRLPSLEFLYMRNTGDDLLRGVRGSQDDFIAPVLRIIPEILPMMNKLRVLILWWTTYPVGTSRTFLNDFDTVREWAKLCPSLLYVVFPLTRTRWIRIPKAEYDFFVPDTIFSCTGTIIRDYNSDDFIVDPRRIRNENIAQWMHDVFELEPDGERIMSAYFRQFRDMRKSEEGKGVVRSVKELLERARVDLIGWEEE